jgi:transposase, IS5 family
MIRYCSHKQLSLAEFDWPFQTALDENNRWVRIPLKPATQTT